MFFIELKDNNIKTGYFVNRDDLPNDIIEKHFMDQCFEVEEKGFETLERYYKNINWFARIIYIADGVQHVWIASYSRCDKGLKMTADEICECIRCRDYIEDNGENIEAVFNLFSPSIVALVIVPGAYALRFYSRYVSPEIREWIIKYYENLPVPVRLSKSIWSISKQKWEANSRLLNRYLNACIDNRCEHL